MKKRSNQLKIRLLLCLWWEQRESNPRPSACKADALNQLSYAPFFSFLFGDNCVRRRIVGRSFTGVNSLPSLLPSLFSPKINFKISFHFRDCVRRRIVGRSFTEVNSLPCYFQKVLMSFPFSNRDCKGMKHFLFCKFYFIFLEAVTDRMSIHPQSPFGDSPAGACGSASLCRHLRCSASSRKPR